MRVEVRNLSRHFGPVKAVDDISFSFESGQIVGFIGPNGAGKTTTMRVMATMDEPTFGEVLYDDVPVSQYPEKIHGLVGFMPDTLPSVSDTTVREYLDFHARAHGLRQPRRHRAVQSIEKFVDLGPLKDSLIASLSKGMKQRVSLARALIHDPPVLILDEPAANLDPERRIELRELLKILADRGKAILISSHILKELEAFIDSTVIIKDGRIRSAGRLEDIVGKQSHVTIIIRPLSRVHDLKNEIRGRPDVESAVIDDDELTVSLLGGDEEAAALLRELTAQGWPIAEFYQRRAGLDSIYIAATGGKS